MPFFSWNPTYSVGVAELDKQHKVLFDLINKLYDAMQVGQGSKEVGNVITEMINYTQFHFTAEEKYLTTYKYIELGKQKASHEGFVKKVKDFQSQYQQGKLAISIEVMNFLRDWLVTHIQVEDKKYSAFLNSKGVS